MRAFRVFVLVLGLAATCDARPASAQQFEIPASARAAIIAETNAYRQTKGLAPLRENASASEEAQAYANYLARTTRQGHSADGRSPFQRLRASGTKFCKFRGENWHEVLDQVLARRARGSGRGSHAFLEAFAGA